MVSNIKVFNQPDIRTGALLFIILILIGIFIKGAGGSPIRQSLIEIRRKFGLSQIEFESAKKQVEIAIAGLKISDVLQEKVNELLLYMRSFDEKIETMKKEMQLVTDKKEKMTADEFKVFKNSYTLHMNELEKILNDYSTAMDSLTKKIRFIVTMSGQNAEIEIRPILDEIKNYFTQNQKNLRELKNYVEQTGFKKSAINS